jgi:NAD(P)-dependent dehydrogenase (short-subunit alcohol dehydrogenase family)
VILSEPTGRARPVLQPAQHALVTGAGSGIGRAIALALAAEGVRLTLVGRDAVRLKAVAEQVGGVGAVVVPADLATEDGIDAVSRAVGPELDLLVHSAGVHVRGSVVHGSACGGKDRPDVGGILTSRTPSIHRQRGAGISGMYATIPTRAWGQTMRT